MNVNDESVSKTPVIHLVISISLITFLHVLSKIYILNDKIFLLSIFASAVLFIYASRKLLSDFIIESEYFKVLIYIFLFYELSIIARGISFSQEDIVTYITSAPILWPLLIPMFVFFTKDISSFIVLLKWIYYIGLVFLVLILIFPSLLLQRLTAESAIALASSCGYILLFSSYINKRKVNISFFIVFISLLSLTYLARRSGMITLLGFILASYVLSLTTKSKTILYRIIPLLVVFSMLFLSSFNNITSVIVGKIDQRMTEDTRSELFDFFFYDMQNDLVIGKGMNGTYFCPVGGEIEDEGIVFAEVDYREIIENGYLQLLLTGGIIHIVLFVLILLPAALAGIFKSKNLFTRACGIAIFLWLVDMFAFGLPTLSINYIFVWICVGICFKPSLRNKTDEEIRIEFQNNGFA